MTTKIILAEVPDFKTLGTLSLCQSPPSVNVEISTLFAKAKDNTLEQSKVKVLFQNPLAIRLFANYLLAYADDLDNLQNTL